MQLLSYDTTLELGGFYVYFIIQTCYFQRKPSYPCGVCVSWMKISNSPLTFFKLAPSCHQLFQKPPAQFLQMRKEESSMLLRSTLSISVSISFWPQTKTKYGWVWIKWKKVGHIYSKIMYVDLKKMPSCDNLCFGRIECFQLALCLLAVLLGDIDVEEVHMVISFLYTFIELVVSYRFFIVFTTDEHVLVKFLCASALLLP